jgi:hypothetical protein
MRASQVGARMARLALPIGTDRSQRWLIVQDDMMTLTIAGLRAADGNGFMAPDWSKAASPRVFGGGRGTPSRPFGPFSRRASGEDHAHVPVPHGATTCDGLELLVYIHSAEDFICVLASSLCWQGVCRQRHRHTRT